jgi:hypothetical protein
MKTKKVKGKNKGGWSPTFFKSLKNKIVSPKNKTCKNFCKKVFLPERERVEKQFNNKYQSIEVLRKTNKSLAKLLEDSFLKSCDDIYCQTSCKTGKDKWVKSFTTKRKEKLIKQGAISGCRDVMEEFPQYYRNI